MIGHIGVGARKILRVQRIFAQISPKCWCASFAHKFLPHRSWRPSFGMTSKKRFARIFDKPKLLGVRLHPASYTTGSDTFTAKRANATIYSPLEAQLVGYLVKLKSVNDIFISRKHDAAKLLYTSFRKSRSAFWKVNEVSTTFGIHKPVPIAGTAMDVICKFSASANTFSSFAKNFSGWGG